MMRMWFGLEIDVVGLPPLGEYSMHYVYFTSFTITFLILSVKSVYEEKR